MPKAETDRAQTNRLNAQHSTRPRTEAGKERSSQNAFCHGLYSKQLIIPGESAAEFDRLRAQLRNEHQPVNTVEEILVDEIAQHFWRLRRFRKIEAEAWQPDSEWLTNNMLALVTRCLASAERSFYRALSALAKLQKARGFVPHQLLVPAAAGADHGFVPESDDESPADPAHHETRTCPQESPFNFTGTNSPKKPSQKIPIAA